MRKNKAKNKKKGKRNAVMAVDADQQIERRMRMMEQQRNFKLDKKVKK